MRCIIALCIFIFTGISFSYAASVASYLPENHAYNPDIAKPESVLGFGIGERHPRHDQMLDYMETLVNQSDRLVLTDMGRTNQLRKQVLVTISSPNNLAKLDGLLKERQLSDEPKADEPLVIWLGYSVHGDEISGTNAAMVVAYHLAASQEASVADMLENTIIVMEPSINPDGMDRFVNWVTTHRGITPNSDPNHIEHHQGWRTGRTNHFGFDLNRDWLLLSQKESQHRLKYFHQYRPHVLGDFHEMGANGSYFFQPGIPTRNHPLTPEKNTELTQLLAGYHAAALDKENRLYYSEESFDDFYYGKGSTYPDINGGVGILFEQASSRGLQQETVNGLLTFSYGIKNQVLTSLSTINGSWENRERLKQYRKEFFLEAEKLAKKEKFSGYLIHEAYDSYRLNAFLDKLNQHQIKIYPLADDFRHNSKLYPQKNTYYIPLAQPQYRVIKALFTQQTDFEDNTFYDVSGWTMPLAMDIEFQQVERTWGLNLRETPWQGQSQPIANKIAADAYAYAFEWHHSMAPKLLNALLASEIKAKVATKAFSAVVNGKEKVFQPGTIVLPAGIQTEAGWRDSILQLAQANQIRLFGLTTGFTPQGIDLGSGSLKLLKSPKVLLVGGKGISQYEAAESLFYLDDMLNVPVTLVEHTRLKKIKLADYSHIFLVDGNYAGFNAALSNQIESWVKSGGVIVAQKRAAKWLSEKGILNVDFVSSNHIDQLFDTEGLRYQDKEKLAGRKRIAGAIFETIIDTSHPLGYGYTHDTLPLFRNSTLIMDKPSLPFVTFAQYSQEPLLSGHTDRNLVNRIANNAAIAAHDLGKGRVIATSDNLAFRGYWLGSAKLLANSLFFAKAFSVAPE